MFKTVNFEYDEDSRVTYCHIVDKNNHVSVGVATCLEDDIDMISKRTGEEIAFRRAKIENLRICRDADLKPRLAALKQLYYSMKHSSKFNPKSYENCMLQR